MENIEEKPRNKGGRPRRNRDVETPQNDLLPKLDTVPSVCEQLNVSGPTVLEMIRTDPEFAACFLMVNGRLRGVRPMIAALIEKRRRERKKVA